MTTIVKLYHKCTKTETNFVLAVVFYIWYKLQKKQILVHQNAIINGVKNIETNGLLQIGTSHIGFSHKHDVTLLNVQGKLIFKGPYTIGRGCRFDIGKNAIVKIGGNGFINPFTKLIIQNGLEIGDNCFISWDCQFLDDDFHAISYEGKIEPSANNIIVADHVWIGCGVYVFKGTQIGKGSVIASNAVVRGIFAEENVLIAGNPARVVKRNIKWC